MKCFKRTLRRKPWDVHKFSNGLRLSKGDKWALNIIFILGSCQEVVPTIMSKNIEKKSMRIVGTRLTRSQKLQVWVGVPVSGLWPWIWTWDVLPRSFFHAYSYRTKTTQVWICDRSWKITLEVTQPFFLKSSWKTKVGATGTTLRPNKLRANGKRPLHQTEKSKTSEDKCEYEAHIFDVRGIVHWKFDPPGQTVNQKFYFEANERGSAKKTPRTVEIGWLVSPSWQRPSSQSFVYDPLFGLSGIDRRSPPTIFIGPSPLWLLFIPDSEKTIERKEICQRVGGENSFAGSTITTWSFSSSTDASIVRIKIGKVHCHQWRIFWRGIKCFCSKCK